MYAAMNESKSNGETEEPLVLSLIKGGILVSPPGTPVKQKFGLVANKNASFSTKLPTATISSSKVKTTVNQITKEFQSPVKSVAPVTPSKKSKVVSEHRFVTPPPRTPQHSGPQCIPVSPTPKTPSMSNRLLKSQSKERKEALFTRIGEIYKPPLTDCATSNVVFSTENHYKRSSSRSPERTIAQTKSGSSSVVGTPKKTPRSGGLYANYSEVEDEEDIKPIAPLFMSPLFDKIQNESCVFTTPEGSEQSVYNAEYEDGLMITPKKSEKHSRKPVAVVTTT
jgi:hypothetical protein